MKPSLFHDLPWTTSQIQPTYSLDEQFGWLLGDRYELDDELGVPVVAWSVYPLRFDTGRGTHLITFQMGHRGELPMFTVWECSQRMVHGRTRAVEVPSADPRSRVAAGDFPWHRESAPVLKTLWAETRARSETEAEAERERRATDPYLNLVDELLNRGGPSWDEEAAARVRELVAGLAPEQQAELLVRVVSAYYDHMSAILDED